MAKVAGKAKARRLRRPEQVAYVVAVREWSFWYRLGVGDRRLVQGSRDETMQMALRGEVVRPAGFKHPRVELDLSASEGPLPEGPATYFGRMEARGDLLTAYAFLPPGGFAAVLAAAAAGQVRFVILEGWTLRYRHSMLRGITLATGLDEDDPPGGPPAGTTAAVGEA